VIRSLPDKFDLLRFDLMIGGYAGQSSFKCYVKFVLWYANETCEVLKICAKILCAKELYEILSSAWAGPMNEAIEKMIGMGNMAIDTGFDGSIWIDKDSLTALYATVDTAINQTLSKQIRFKLLVTGDLAFLAMTLGKENSSGYHCYICESKN